MTIRLAISVEGQTEERFIKRVIAPHLETFAIWTTPIVIATSRSAHGGKSKGGGINVDRTASELRRLLPSHDRVTTLYDFYGFGDKQANETPAALEARIASRLGNPPNFIGYVQQYEFENLLLSDPKTAAGFFAAPGLAAAMQAEIDKAGGAEAVNDSHETAPSRRLEAWTRRHGSARIYNGGSKVELGPELASKLTLPAIRRACPRFDRWLSRLECLAAA